MPVTKAAARRCSFLYPHSRVAFGPRFRLPLRARCHNYIRLYAPARQSAEWRANGRPGGGKMLTIQQMLRMGSGVLGHKFFGLARPLNVMLAVTDRCNSRCRYCNIPGRGHPDETTEQLLKLIDEIAAAGAVRLGLWGGEPLLRDDIGELVDHAKSRGLYVTMDTNGLLWPERAAELRALDHVIFARRPA